MSKNPIKKSVDLAAQAEKEKIAENEEKVREFKWDDTDIDESESTKLLTVPSGDIIKCVFVLSDYLLSNISVEYFAEMGASGMRFVIPVELSLHNLLQKRFEEDWNLDSRIDMFQLIRERLEAEFSTGDKRDELNKKIQTALPPSFRKQFTSGQVSLEDDAMIVGDESNTVSIEIQIEVV